MTPRSFSCSKVRRNTDSTKKTCVVPAPANARASHSAPFIDLCSLNAISSRSECQPAIDNDGLPGDHRRTGTQEEDRLGDVLGLAGAFEWCALDRGALPVLRPVLLPRAVDMARRHRVDPDFR